ncbi:DUF86 domain-containing protein [Thermodesulfobacteriota bacterium]
MVDKTLVLRKFAELDEYLKQISEYEMLGADEYSENWKAQRIIDRTLHMMIEVCLDIAGHIISDKAFRVPANCADIFRVLQEQKILDADLSDTMQQMARFRNLVVHHYDKTDPAIVINILRNSLKDFKEFEKTVISLFAGNLALCARRQKETDHWRGSWPFGLWPKSKPGSLSPVVYF